MGYVLYTQFTSPFPSLAEVGQVCETSLELSVTIWSVSVMIKLSSMRKIEDELTE